jgi:hypothetical protein
VFLCACVGDDNSQTDAGIDATGNDAGNDATCVPIAAQPGVDCFSGGRCTPQTQECCVGLTPSGLIGQCQDAGTCGAPPYMETWGCDKAFDCTVQAPKCCATQASQQTVLSNLSGSCPIQLKVTVPEGGADAQPPPFAIAKCQADCNGLIQLCASEAECGDAGLKCRPVEFTQTSFSKTFGVCLP